LCECEEVSAEVGWRGRRRGSIRREIVVRATGMGQVEDGVTSSNIYAKINTVPQYAPKSFIPPAPPY